MTETSGYTLIVSSYAGDTRHVLHLSECLRLPHEGIRRQSCRRLYLPFSFSLLYHRRWAKGEHCITSVSEIGLLNTAGKSEWLALQGIRVRILSCRVERRTISLAPRCSTSFSYTGEHVMDMPVVIWKTHATIHRLCTELEYSLVYYMHGLYCPNNHCPEK